MERRLSESLIDLDYEDEPVRETYKLIRNQWEKTPLERIEQAITEASNQMSVEKNGLKQLTDQSSREQQQKEIEKLKKTVQTLQQEADKRIVRVRNLKAQRLTVLDKITNTRHRLDNISQPGLRRLLNRGIQKMIRTINRIDDELGPFRGMDQTFYLD